MPAQLLALLTLVLALQLPLLWAGLPLTAAELRALLVGEALHGGAMPYRDLYDGTAPLAAAAFALLDMLYSRPVLLYRALALSLLLLQALRLNTVFTRADVHPERGYLVALTYLLLGSITTDLDTLSPLLLGHTFVVLALSALLPTQREGYDSHRLFRAGVLIGVAALCYLPLALFVLVGLFAVIVFAANAFRSFLLLVCGLLFPYALVATFFAYTGALNGFIDFHLEPGLLRFDSGPAGLPLAVQLRLFLVPGVVLAAAVLRSLGTTLGPVFQAKFRQLLLVWLLVAGALVLAVGGTAPGIAVLLLPPAAYFSLFLWQKSHVRWLPELGLLLLLAMVLLVRHRALIPGLVSRLHFPAESQFGLLPDLRYRAFRGQRVLVLGADHRPYLHNQLATPYLDWLLAQNDFGHLNEYGAVVRVAQEMRQDPPPFLIDQAGLLPRLRHQMPVAFGQYQLTAMPGLYRRQQSPARPMPYVAPLPAPDSAAGKPRAVPSPAAGR